MSDNDKEQKTLTTINPEYSQNKQSGFIVLFSVFHIFFLIFLIILYYLGVFDDAIDWLKRNL